MNQQQPASPADTPFYESSRTLYGVSVLASRAKLDSVSDASIPELSVIKRKKSVEQEHVLQHAGVVLTDTMSAMNQLQPASPPDTPFYGSSCMLHGVSVLASRVELDSVSDASILNHTGTKRKRSVEQEYSSKKHAGVKSSTNDKINRRLHEFQRSMSKIIIGTKFIHILVPLDTAYNPIYENQLNIGSTDGIGNAIESMINEKVREKKAGKYIKVNESSQKWPDYFLKVSGKKIPVELKVFKGNSFANDLGNLRVILQKMAKFDKEHNDGLDVFLNQAWYVLINYTFDKDVIEPKHMFLKRIWQIAGRGPDTGQLNNGGSACNLRTNTTTIKKLTTTPVTNTKESFVETVLDALYSDEPKCISIRKKASISTEDGITMYNSILEQAKELNITINCKYTRMIN